MSDIMGRWKIMQSNQINKFLQKLFFDDIFIYIFNKKNNKYKIFFGHNDLKTYVLTKKCIFDKVFFCII